MVKPHSETLNSLRSFDCYWLSKYRPNVESDSKHTFKKQNVWESGKVQILPVSLPQTKPKKSRIWRPINHSKQQGVQNLIPIHRSQSKQMQQQTASYSERLLRQVLPVVTHST